ncbi:hypothetical protein SDC9_131972 [bioreactor metagenome]|uniref:Uncharacterized protein n=1 Tax=bioreactor metagenome TaxID=1076179 RepID=A0A645D699_9ZZZZ
MFFGHDIADRNLVICNEAQIAVRQNTYQLAVFHIVDDRHTADAVFAHQILCFGNQVIRGQEEWVDDNATFGTFYFVHFFSLRFDGHVFVDDAQAALASHCDCHCCIGYCVHTCAYDRNIQV